MTRSELELVRSKEQKAWVNLSYMNSHLEENNPYLLRARAEWRVLADLLDELELMNGRKKI